MPAHLPELLDHLRGQQRFRALLAVGDRHFHLGPSAVDLGDLLRVDRRDSVSRAAQRRERTLARAPALRLQQNAPPSLL
eukprot:217242-Chlamydomonas_euryale.AAC.4